MATKEAVDTDHTAVSRCTVMVFWSGQPCRGARKIEIYSAPQSVSFCFFHNPFPFRDGSDEIRFIEEFVRM